MPRHAPGEASAYTGTWDCVKKTVKREDFWGSIKEWVHQLQELLNSSDD
jgi:leucyl aminopeptidase (aminopeptidase T)